MFVTLEKQESQVNDPSEATGRIHKMDITFYLLAGTINNTELRDGVLTWTKRKKHLQDRHAKTDEDPRSHNQEHCIAFCFMSRTLDDIGMFVKIIQVIKRHTQPPKALSCFAPDKSCR